MNCGPMPCKEVDTSVAVASGPRESSKNWVLAATILGSSMEFIDGTVVNVALPNLQSSLGAPAAHHRAVRRRRSRVAGDRQTRLARDRKQARRPRYPIGVAFAAGPTRRHRPRAGTATQSAR